MSIDELTAKQSCCWSTQELILKHFSIFGGLRFVSEISTTFCKEKKILGGKRNVAIWI